MRHFKAGRKLSVDAPHRKAMLRSLTLTLIEHEAIKTTLSRAKALRWYADHVVTLAKRGDVASRRQMISLLGCTETRPNHDNRVRTAIDRVYTKLAPRFKTRNGGYTQILRLVRHRAGDNAEMVVFRYLPELDEKKDKKAKAKTDAKKKPVAKETHKHDRNEHKHEHKAKGGDADEKKAKKVAAPQDKEPKVKKKDKEEDKA